MRKNKYALYVKINRKQTVKDLAIIPITSNA